jgi:hypothetical protein
MLDVCSKRTSKAFLGESKYTFCPGGCSIADIKRRYTKYIGA